MVDLLTTSSRGLQEAFDVLGSTEPTSSSEARGYALILDEILMPLAMLKVAWHNQASKIY